MIDSQSVKTTEAGGPCGYDAGKKIKGRKRHAMVNTDGRPLVIQAHSADIQDRDGAVPLLKASRGSFPFVEVAFADGAYKAGRVKDATPDHHRHRQEDRPSGRLRGPAQTPGRRANLRLAQPSRRLAKDFEATIDSAAAFLYAASVMLLTSTLPDWTFRWKRPRCASSTQAGGS